MPIVVVPAPYRGPTLGKENIPVEAPSVRAAVQAVDAEYPGFAVQVFDGRGQLHRFVKIFVDGEPAGPDTPTAPDTEVEIVAAIGGGSA